MKKLIYLLLFFFIGAGNTFAQYCGNSGPSQCTASGTLNDPGLSPRSDSLEPFRNGIASTTVIQFKNFNQVFFGGNPFTLQSLKIDSIENLPNGLCWATDRASNTYLNSEDGCIKVNGTPCDAPGQYKLRIIASADVGFGPIQVNAASVGLHYFLRLGNVGDNVPPCDTLQTVEFYNVGYSTVTNCSGCPTFTFTQSATTNTSCATPNGTISVTASGGTGPYTYYLGVNNNSTGNFAGVAGGTYDVIAVDANACRDTVSVTVPATTPVITVSTLNTTPKTSCTANNGGFTVAAGGGTGPYTFSITGTTNSTGAFTSLAAGNYTVTAIDANMCSGTATVNVPNMTPGLTVSLVNSTPQTSCTANNGSVTVSASGGMMYTYAIGMNTNTSGIFTGLAAGSYTVMATDGAGCVGSLNVTIANNVPVIIANASSTNASSASATDGTATVTANGSTSFTYLWSDGQTTATATGLAPGTYTVTVSEPNGCSVSASTTVSFNNSVNGLIGEIISMSIFPNPATDNVTLSASFLNAKDVTIEIFNANGSKVQSKDAGTTDTLLENFSVKNMAKGTYFVMLTANGKRASYPFVVE